MANYQGGDILDELFGAKPKAPASSNLPPPPPYDECNPSPHPQPPQQPQPPYPQYPPQPQNPYISGQSPPPQQQQQQPSYAAPPPQQQPYGTYRPYGAEHGVAQGYYSPTGAPLSPPQQQQAYYPLQQQQPQPGPGPYPQPQTPQGTAASPAAAPPAPAKSQEDEDREQLERIIRLRKELELEQQREQEKREQLSTWACPVCTFRNPLGEGTCGMCGSARSGSAPAAAVVAPPARQQPPPSSPPQQQQQQQVRGVAGPTAWQCGICYAPNGERDERCRSCYAFRKDGIPVASGGSGGGRGAVAVSTSNWRCAVCGDVNPPTASNCRVCNGYQRNGTATDAPVTVGGGRPAVSPPPPQQPQQQQTTWACSVCTLENSVSSAVCAVCGSGQRPRHLAPPSGASASATGRKPDAEAFWACPTCTFENPRRRKRCDMCGAKRPGGGGVGGGESRERERDHDRRQVVDSDNEEEGAATRPEHGEDDDDGEALWQEDHVVQDCNRCHQPFGFYRRRHHCRACGFIFCATCSPYYDVLRADGDPERTCVACHEAREEEARLRKKRR